MVQETAKPHRRRKNEPNGTYLFELAAQPGGPEGRSDTTAGSEPISVVDRPRSERPPRTALEDATHFVPNPVLGRRSQPTPGCEALRSCVCVNRGAERASPASPVVAPLFSCVDSNGTSACREFHTRYDSSGNLQSCTATAPTRTDTDDPGGMANVHGRWGASFHEKHDVIDEIVGADGAP
jgi:hypothetical protein